MLAIVPRMPTVAATGLTTFRAPLFGMGEDTTVPGSSRVVLARQGASLIDKIIQGARPADLPVEQPTRYVTSINLKTAKSLGLTLSPALLASADEVIE